VKSLGSQGKEEGLPTRDPGISREEDARPEGRHPPTGTKSLAGDPARDEQVPSGPPATIRTAACTNKSVPATPPEPWHARGRKHAYEGHALTLREWAERTGLPNEVLQTRLNRRNWPIECALTEPLGRRMPKPSRSEPDQVAWILEQLVAARPHATGATEALHQGAQSGS
jgi:hypothetical protein